MPFKQDSTYNPPLFLKWGHLQTIYPTLFRVIKGVQYRREVLELADGDFLDLDWSTTQSKRLCVISHGLEGSSQSSYVLGMVKALNLAGIDALAWNMRGCGGNINRKVHYYHSGLSSDLDQVLQYVSNSKQYSEINLIGYSLGANLTLKYLGEPWETHSRINKAVAVSVPLHLKSSAQQLSLLENKLYLNLFLKLFYKKLLAKQNQFPEKIDLSQYHQVKSFYDFDTEYTARYFGWKDANEYWECNSSLYFLNNISTPTLIINAIDDPLLGDECYPRELLAKHSKITLETPKYGGHVGFVSLNRDKVYWSEKRIVEFLNDE